MDAVLGFVDDQEPVAAVRQRQRYAEQSHGSVAQALQRNGSGVALEPYDRPSPESATQVLRNHGHAMHSLAHDEPQSIDGRVLVVR